MSTDFWAANKHDPRVQAALQRKCPTCKASPGYACGWWRGKPPHFHTLKTGVVHHIRVPETALFGVYR